MMGEEPPGRRPDPEETVHFQPSSIKSPVLRERVVVHIGPRPGSVQNGSAIIVTLPQNFLQPSGVVEFD